MHITNEAQMKKAQEENAVVRRAADYESQVSQIPFGYLNSFDVVKLWASDEESTTANVGARAREIVIEQGLPLHEFGAGRWVVAHIN